MRKNKVRMMGYCSLVGLFLLMLMLCSPIVWDVSYATCAEGGGTEGCLAEPLATELGITTNTVISLALDNQVQMDVTPKSNGATSYASTKLAVSTNSNDGYAIYLQTGSENGSLTGVTNNLDREISNTSKTNVTLENLENNSYGYALSKTAVNDHTTYSHVPTSNTAIESTTGSTESSGEYAYGDMYYLAFGTKVGTSLPAGKYAGTVTVSAVANPTTLRSLYDLTYMQEMTSDICNNTKEHYTKQLVDNRDGKSYWVAKLKDGNCWMTQNLGMDIGVDAEGNATAVSKNGANVVLDETNTDILGKWGKDSENPPKATSKAIPSRHVEGVNTSTYSWTAGEIVLSNPVTANGCEQVSNGDNLLSYGKLLSTIAEVCSEQYKDVSNMRDSYIATNGSSYDGNSYDGHYLIGNWYSYGATVAGNIPANDNESASYSICANGWKIPEPNGYAGLTSAYEVNSSNAKTVFATKPLYFVRPGYINAGNESLHYPARNGRYWSSVLIDGSLANALDFYSGGVGTNYRAYRHFGLSVRCMAR